MKRHYSTNGSLRTTCNNASIRPNLITYAASLYPPPAFHTYTHTLKHSTRPRPIVPARSSYAQQAYSGVVQTTRLKSTRVSSISRQMFQVYPTVNAKKCSIIYVIYIFHYKFLTDGLAY